MAIGIDTGFLVASEIGEHPGHRVARDLLIEQASKRNTFVLCPQVLAEFIHVVTDPRRFKNPIPMPEALSRTESLWNAKEIRKVYASDDSTALFLHWMRIHRLGRNRILDTQLAAVYYSANVKEIATTDFRDFKVYEVFNIYEI
jgi:predicted nucleic acid-binding protein